MLFHASFTAADPARAASAVAAIWGEGRALPVPFLAEGTWIAMTGDVHGTMIEVLPRGTEFHHQPGEHLAVRAGEGARESGFHLLTGSPFDAERVIAIAAAHGFAAHLADHGGLDVIEVWIDGSFLLEVITPEVQAQYRERVTIANAETLSAATYGTEALAA